MRHGVRGRKLGRTASHRVAMFRNQLAALVDKERIITTLHKAKELRPIAERVITQTKRGGLHARRMAGRWLADRDLLKKLFDDIGPRMSSRPGGYLRIVKLGSRQGDGAELAVLELVDFQPSRPPAPPEDSKGKKAKGGDDAAEGDKAEKKAKAKAKKSAQPKAGPRAKAEKRVRTDAHAKGAAKVKTPRKAGGE